MIKFDASPLVTTPRWDDGMGQTRFDNDHCVLCGRRLRNPAKPSGRIHGIDGDPFILAPVDADPADINEAGDMGFWPIGSECKKRIPQEYVA